MRFDTILLNWSTLTVRSMFRQSRTSLIPFKASRLYKRKRDPDMKKHIPFYTAFGGFFFGGEKPYEGSLQPIETADELTKNDKTYVCWDK